MRIDPARTRVIITVRAEGLLARAAHDIQLEAREPRGAREGDELRARFLVRELRAVGTSPHGKDEFRAPSPKDAADIERRVREIALAGGDAIEVIGTRDRVRVIAPRGAQEVRPRGLAIGPDFVRGSCVLSLRALGATEVKLPLGAARTSDAIEVDFDVALTDRASA